jgi:hypothetical protein
MCVLLQLVTLTRALLFTISAAAMLLQMIKPDFSNFDEAGAWPYLMDEFVDFMKKRNGMAVDS